MNDQQRAAMQEIEDYLRDCANSPTMAAKLAALREALAQPQGEWVDLTEDEMQDCHCLNGTAYPFALAIIAKFKSKNTPSVVPQGEPVANPICYLWIDPLTRNYIVDRCDHPTEEIIPVYTTPPSVEAAIEATKEKAAKVCEIYEQASTTENDIGMAMVFQHCAAAIRSMK